MTIRRQPTLGLLALLATGVGCARMVPGTSRQVPAAPTPAAPTPAAPLPGPTCPGQRAGAAADAGDLIRRSYRPALFSRGDDATGEADCRGGPNPERGFFAFRDLLAPRIDLQGLRESGVSLVYGKVLLESYRDRPLDPGLIHRLGAAFASIRRAGLKVLPRFYYAADDKADDAPNARALGHIAALAPLLRANADVIAALHAGFLGAWGEWHPEQRASAADRKRILDALLAALPPTRMVLVRRPHFKEVSFGGPLTAALAFSGTPLARLGHLNDCFLASPTDLGTFRSPAEERYAASDAAFVAVGGETCAPNPPRSDCPSALAELERHRWSFVNRDYHPAVLASWRQGGCWPTIACRLGYRFVLRAFSLPARVRAGTVLSLAVSLTNDGYARAFNPRPVFLALARQQGPGPSTTPPRLLPTGRDARMWAPGEDTTACLNAPLPGDLPAGEYRVGLALPDPEPTLAADPRYAVQMGGRVGFDAPAGINWLDATLAVTR